MSRIIGNVRQICTAPALTWVKFDLLSKNLIVEDSLIASGDKTVRTDCSGNFQITLGMGDYRMTINGRDQFTVSVPDDDATYDVIQRIVSAATYSPTAPVGGAQPTASPTVLGVIKCDRAHTAPKAETVPRFEPVIYDPPDLVIDFDGVKCPRVAITSAAINVSTMHRVQLPCLCDGPEPKGILLRLFNAAGEPATITLDPDMEIYGTNPLQIPAGRAALVGLFSFGPDESDTLARIVRQAA